MMAASNRGQLARWRRVAAGALAGAALALSAGLGAGTAQAADVIDALVDKYSLGSGGGHVSNLLSEIVELRAQGIPPKASDLAAIEASVQYLPNQMRLLQALSATADNQQKLQSRMAPQGGSGSGGIGVGINMEPWLPQNGNPMIQDDPIFPMPGRS
jgi:hypothetical protein